MPLSCGDTVDEKTGSAKWLSDDVLLRPRNCAGLGVFFAVRTASYSKLEALDLSIEREYNSCIPQASISFSICSAI